MGKINEYQRQRLVSSVVGTPGVDQSGVEIGNTVGKVADAFITRQHALDNAEVANAFYSYQMQDDVQRLKLQNQFKSQPEAFEQEYTRANSELTRSFRDKLPERTRSRFETLVGRRNASVVPQNQKWLFDAQNAKGMDLLNMTGNEFVMSAQTWGSAERFVEETGKFRETFKNDLAPLILNPDKAEQVYLKNAARMHLSSMMDLNNGNPVKLRYDLENNEAFKKQVVESLGAAGYASALKTAQAQVKNLFSEQTYDAYAKEFSPEARVKWDKMYNDPQGISVAEAENQVMLAEHALDTLMKQPTVDEAPEQVQALQAILEDRKLDLEHATFRSNHRVKSKPEVYAELQGLVLGIQGELPSSEKQKKEFAAETAAGTEGVRDRPLTLSEEISSYVNPLNVVKEGVNAFVRLQTFGGLEVIKTKSTAPETHTDQYVRMMEVQAEVKKARNRGDITDKQTHTLLKNFVFPMTQIEQYDRLAKGDSPFVKMYEAADVYARNLVIDAPRGTPTSELKKMRMNVRAKMMDRFADKLAFLTDVNSTLTPEDVQLRGSGADGLIASVLNEFASSYYRGVKPGQNVIGTDGRVMEFGGVDPKTGRPITITPKNIKKSLGNI